MERVKRLEQLTPADAPHVGGKAWNCARLKQAGFAVPGGVAIPVGTEESPGLWRELDTWLATLPLETLFAVRSSAIGEDSAGQSFAGIHETRLNVTRDGVAKAVRACWASAGSLRAEAYRHAQGLLSEPARMGVLVQKMVPAVVSGVAFTVNPTSGAEDELVINSTWGLGEPLVSGQVEPDEFRLQKKSATVLEARTGSKRFRLSATAGSSTAASDPGLRDQPCLTSSQLSELGALLVRLEKFCAGPQDVEWCHDGEQFWIVQSRPVTAQRRPAPDIEWTRANFREVLPDLPSPQAMGMIRELLNRVEPAFYGRLLGPPELGPMVKIFCGRPYFNASRIRYLCRLSRVPAARIMRTIGHAGDVTAEDEARPRPPLREFLPALPALLLAAGRQLGLDRRVRKQLQETARLAALVKGRDPKELSDAEWSATLDVWLQEHPRWLFVVLVLAGVGLYEDLFEGLCARIGFPAETLLRPHLAAPPPSVSTQQAFDLLALARAALEEPRARDYFLSAADAFAGFREELDNSEFLRRFEVFLDNYGHRGTSIMLLRPCARSSSVTPGISRASAMA
ncbi:MAG: PEP/pyruvate-binding domain-containing protein, partial [Acidobacteria bacterium]|nr:PEP/pyruvate-binding domain-containing protein [Acidobacteriota bacterium]